MSKCGVEEEYLEKIKKHLIFGPIITVPAIRKMHENMFAVTMISVAKTRGAESISDSLQVTLAIKQLSFNPASRNRATSAIP